MPRRRTKPTPTTLITGASTGIGRELAKVFAEHGHDLLLVARRKDKLDALARELRDDRGVRVTVIPKDLTEPGAARSLFTSIRRRRLEVDVLVNNAGVVEQGEFVAMDPARLNEIIQLNAVALTEMTRLFVRPMVERGEGRILNVASTSAFQPVAFMAVYAATKAFVLSLTEALSEELAGSGVTLTALCPGFTETPMLAHVREAHEAAGLLPDLFISDPRTVAREGYDAAMRGEVVHVSGVFNQVLATATSLQPRWLRRAFAGFIGKRAI
jgi:short-subunit dehydrogenase